MAAALKAGQVNLDDPASTIVLLKANAVVGVRYDATEIAPGITEVLCYGTAVFVEAAR